MENSFCFVTHYNRIDYSDRALYNRIFSTIELILCKLSFLSVKVSLAKPLILKKSFLDCQKEFIIQFLPQQQN